jgi:anti-sigma B factor antagonist
MNLIYEHACGWTIVCPEGRVDAGTSAELEISLASLIEKGCTRLLLDCSGLNYISSSGLRVFLVIKKKMVSLSGRFEISGLSPNIKEIFDISGFSSMFKIYPNRESAFKN